MSTEFKLYLKKVVKCIITFENLGNMHFAIDTLFRILDSSCLFCILLFL